jgi:hypothetical protein
MSGLSLQRWLVLLFPLGWLASGVGTFFLTRRASRRPWLWALVALVAYFVAYRATIVLFYADVPSDGTLARAFRDGLISLNSYEEGCAEFYQSRQIASVVALIPGLLVGVIRRRLADEPQIPKEMPKRRRKKKRRAHEPIAGEGGRRSRVRDAEKKQGAEPNVYAPPADGKAEEER